MSSTEAGLNPKWSGNRPLRVLVAYNPEHDTVQGYVEHSFNMGLDFDRVLVFWSGTASSIIGPVQLDAIADAEDNMRGAKHELFMFDPESADCPIVVDLDGWKAERGDKFKRRNATFNVKEGGKWQLRALLAERKLQRIARWAEEAKPQNTKSAGQIFRSRVERAIKATGKIPDY